MVYTGPTSVQREFHVISQARYSHELVRCTRELTAAVDEQCIVPLTEQVPVRIAGVERFSLAN